MNSSKQNKTLIAFLFSLSIASSYLVGMDKKVVEKEDPGVVYVKPELFVITKYGTYSSIERGEWATIDYQVDIKRLTKDEYYDYTQVVTFKDQKK